MQHAACYREFLPAPALRGSVRSFFTFSVPAVPDPCRRALLRERNFAQGDAYSAPLFADGHMSICFSFGGEYAIDGLWEPSGPPGHVIGAISRARTASHGSRIVQIGAYFRVAQAPRLFGLPAHELTDRVLPLSDLWGRTAEGLEERLAEAVTDDERVNLLEAALLRRPLRGDQSSLDLAAIGQTTVEGLARAAGVSRQHLRRRFLDQVGISPKLYLRLARFRAALGRSGPGASLAAELGYSDQSHMIAEFREFSGLTPASFSTSGHFHPFKGTAP
jgi:AraC-like DNA-binding protein